MAKTPEEDKLKGSTSKVDNIDIDAAVDEVVEQLTTNTPNPEEESEILEEVVEIAEVDDPTKADEETEVPTSVESERVTVVEETEDSGNNLVEDKEAEASTTEEVVEVDSLTKEDKETEVPTSVESERVTVVEETEDSGNNLVEDKGAKISSTEETAEVDSLIEGHAEPGKASISADKSVATDLSDAVREEAINETPKPKKKSKAPLIIFLCLLLCAIGGLIAWLIIRSTPENQVTDAISGLLTAKQVSTTGTFNVKFDQSTNPDIRSVRLDIGATSAHIPATANATLSVTTQSNSTFKVDLGETISRDGTIYIKISGLKKAINNAKVPDEVQYYLNYFSSVIDKTDNQWWMIAIPDLLDQVSNTLDQDLGTSYADAYQCILNQVADNDGSELAELYKKYPFVDVANYTGTTLQPVDNGTIFSISVNQVQLTNFQNELGNTEYQKSLAQCTAQITSDNAETESNQIDNALDTLADLPPAYVEVSGFDHHLSRFYYNYESEDVGSFNLDLRFSFPNAVSIDTPNDARAITELIDDIVDSFNGMLYDIYYSSSYPQDCINGNSTNCIILN